MIDRFTEFNNMYQVNKNNDLNMRMLYENTYLSLARFVENEVPDVIEYASWAEAKSHMDSFSQFDLTSRSILLNIMGNVGYTDAKILKYTSDANGFDFCDLKVNSVSKNYFNWGISLRNNTYDGSYIGEYLLNYVFVPDGESVTIDGVAYPAEGVNRIVSGFESASLEDIQDGGCIASYNITAISDESKVYVNGVRANYSYTLSDALITDDFTLLASQDDGGQYMGVWGDGTYIYVGMYTGVSAYTFNGTGFTLVATQGDGSNYYDVWGDGTYIYTACDADGVRAYTFNGTGFTLLDTIDEGANYYAVYGDGSYIYTVTGSGGICAYTFDGAEFVLKQRLDDGGTYRDVWGDGTYIYAACGDAGVRAYTFNGTAFTLITTHDADGGSGNYRDIWGDGTYIYVACSTHGFRAYTFNGTGFTLLDTAAGSAEFDGVWSDGTYIYAIYGANGIRAYTFNGTGFTLIDTIDDEGTYQAVWGDGSYLYVGCSTYGLRAYSFGTPRYFTRRELANIVTLDYDSESDIVLNSYFSNTDLTYYDYWFGAFGNLSSAMNSAGYALYTTYKNAGYDTTDDIPSDELVIYPDWLMSNLDALHGLNQTEFLFIYYTLLSQLNESYIWDGNDISSANFNITTDFADYMVNATLVHAGSEVFNHSLVWMSILHNDLTITKGETVTLDQTVLFYDTSISRLYMGYSGDNLTCHNITYKTEDVPSADLTITSLDILLNALYGISLEGETNSSLDALLAALGSTAADVGWLLYVGIGAIIGGVILMAVAKDNKGISKLGLLLIIAGIVILAWIWIIQPMLSGVLDGVTDSILALFGKGWLW